MMHRLPSNVAQEKEDNEDDAKRKVDVDKNGLITEVIVSEDNMEEEDTQHRQNVM